jgi:predicted phosphodiesterase
VGKLSDKLAAAPTAKEITSDKRRIKRLENTIEGLERQLHDARQCRFTLPTGKPRTASGRKSFCRVVIPDSHGSVIDPAACRAFLTDLEQINPAEIVMLGDHLDCGGFLAQHHTMGYVAETKYTFEDDCNAANQFLDAIQSRAPGATIHYLEGNHERRIETWIVDQTVRNQADAAFLHRLFSTSVVLHLEKRGVRFYPQGTISGTSSIPAIIQLGKCRFTHGIYTTKNAAKSHVDEYVCNIVYGHTHRADSYTRRTVDDTYSAWNPGCLCVQQKFWNHSRNTHHTHGYGLQAVQGDGGFLHLNIPIIDGLSYLKPLAASLK